MSKGRLSRLARNAAILEIPATETRAKAVHHGLFVIAIAQLKLAHPVVQGLRSDTSQLSIRPSETKDKLLTGNADSAQDVDYLL